MSYRNVWRAAFVNVRRHINLMLKEARADQRDYEKADAKEIGAGGSSDFYDAAQRGLGKLQALEEIKRTLTTLEAWGLEEAKQRGQK